MNLSTSKVSIFLEITIFTALIVYLYINQYNIPVYDEWELSTLVKQYYDGTLTLETLMTPHNECRMLYPHIINLIIILLTKWQTFYLVTFNMLLLLGFYWLFKKKVSNLLNTPSNFINQVLFLMGFIIIFSLKNYEGIISGFILCHYLMIVCTFLSFIFLKTITWRNIFISCLLAHIATLSYATGFLTWMCLILLILLNNINTRVKIGYISFVSLSLVIQILFYFHNYHSYSTISERTYNLLKIIPFSLSFLSVNLAVAALKSSILTVIQLMSIISAFYWIFRFDKAKLTQWMPFFMFAFFGILTGLMTAYGRASEGVEASLARRYCTLSLPFTLMFFVSIMINLNYLNRWKSAISLRYYPLSSIPIVCSLFYFIQIQNKYLKVSDKRNQDTIIAKQHILMSDFEHPSVKENIFPFPEKLAEKVAIMKKYKMGIF
jgi:hypothetical protein